MTSQLGNIVDCTVNLTPLAESRMTNPCRIVLQPLNMNDHSSTLTTTQCDPVRRSSRIRKKRDILDL